MDAIRCALGELSGCGVPMNTRKAQQCGRRRVDVDAAQVQNPESTAAASDLLGESEHVLRRPAQPVQSHADESVAVLKGVEGAVEVGP